MVTVSRSSLASWMADDGKRNEWTWFMDPECWELRNSCSIADVTAFEMASSWSTNQENERGERVLLSKESSYETADARCMFTW